MTTLVERLRDCVAVTFASGLHGVERDCKDAAKEIVRLTAELADAHQIIKDDVATREALRLHMALVMIATGAYRGDVQDFARVALSPEGKKPTP